MKLTKLQRKQLHDKYGGKCAYCGCELPDKWHADHIEAIYRNTIVYDKQQAKLVSASKPHLDIIENLNPSCPRCNNYKHTLTLEGFRQELSRQVERCMNNCNFTLALKYKQVSIHETPIVFYFERFNK